MCPCGEGTAQDTRYISAHYTDHAMGWAIGGPGLDSQGRQRLLFAGGSGLALAPTEPPTSPIGIGGGRAIVRDVIRPGVKLTTV